MNFVKKYGPYALYTLIVGVVFALDQISKIIVESTISLNSSVKVLGNFFKLTYIHNDGAAFGIFSGQTIYLVLFSILVIFFILYQFYSYKDSKVICLSFAVLLGGLLGNLADRVTLGYVRDFFDFNIFKYSAPIFNVSDIFIVLSITVIIVTIMVYEGGVPVEFKDKDRGRRTKTRHVSNKQTGKKQK